MAGYPDEEVDHEEDVEGEVDLLRGAVGPFLTRLNRLTAHAQSRRKHTHNRPAVYIARTIESTPSHS